DDLGALGASPFDLHRGRVRGHDDDRADAEPLGGAGYGARMVARRNGDDAALPLLGRQLQQSVARSPQLERAAGLQALTFEPDSPTRDFAVDQRRASNSAGYPFRSGQHIVARDPNPFG